MRLRNGHPAREAAVADLVRRRGPVLALLAGAAAACAILLFADPYAAGSILPACPFHALTRLYCPGCGTTRALHALLHGRLGLALDMNPLAVLAVPLIPAILARPRFPDQAWLVKLADARLWLCVILGFSVLRNLPWAPFAWLAPG